MQYFHRGHGCHSSAIRVSNNPFRTVLNILRINFRYHQRTCSSRRQAEELSTTTAPASAKPGSIFTRSRSPSREHRNIDTGKISALYVLYRYLLTAKSELGTRAARGSKQANVSCRGKLFPLAESALPVRPDQSPLLAQPLILYSSPGTSINHGFSFFRI